MSISVTESNDLITFREVLGILGRPKMAVSTVHRWRSPGVLIDGRRVRLAAERIAGRWYTTREALEAFRAACQPDQPDDEAPAPRLADDTQRRADLAGAQLDAMLKPKRGRPRKVSA